MQHATREEEHREPRAEADTYATRIVSVAWTKACGLNPIDPRALTLSKLGENHIRLEILPRKPPHAACRHVEPIPIEVG